MLLEVQTPLRLKLVGLAHFGSNKGCRNIIPSSRRDIHANAGREMPCDSAAHGHRYDAGNVLK